MLCGFNSIGMPLTLANFCIHTNSHKNRDVEQMKTQRNVMPEYEKKMKAEISESYESFCIGARKIDDSDIQLLQLNKEKRLEQVDYPCYVHFTSHH